jgi:uncharacterized damage-inducible protein DinB
MRYPQLQSRADVLAMLDEMLAARQQILERCGKLSEAQLNDPVYAGTWSLLQNLSHLAWAEAYMLAWIKKRPGTLPREEFPPQVPPQVPAIRTALDEAHAAAVAFLKSNPEEVLRETCLFSKHGEQTVGGVFFHIIEHEIHHRAFLLNKLARLGG